MTPMHTDTPSQAAQERQRRVRLAILILGTLITFAMIYGSGMRAKVRDAKKIDERRKLAEQNLRGVQREAQLRLALAQQLEARRMIAVALDQLDARNFGQAQEATRVAADLLAQAQKANSTNPDFADVAAALGQASQTTIGSSPDLASARAPLVEAARQMDAKFTPYVQEFLQRSQEADAAHPIKAPTMNDVPQFVGNDVTRTE